MSQQDYQRYVEQGPDSLSLSGVTAALDWFRENPTEAFAIKQAHETQRRLFEAEEVARETWVRGGGDASLFKQAYDELARDARKEEIRRTEEEAHASAWRAFRSGF